MTASERRAWLAHPWVYFALAFGWSWAFWGAAVLTGKGLSSPMGLAFGLLGLLGPMVGGITCTYLTRDREGRREYWRRVFDVRRIGARWYALIVLFVPVLFALSVLLDRLTGGTGTHWEAQALRIAAAPLTLVPFVLSILLVGPMEEFGWRGYVLDRLQERLTPLQASLVLGVCWSAWHLPLFLIPDSYQQALGLGSLAFWLFVIGIVPLTVVMTWIFNNTRRSTLAAMLFHFMVNFVGELVALSQRAEVFSIPLWTLAALALAGSGRLKPAQGR